MGNHPFNAEEYDRPDFKGNPASYIVCTAPRCGGTLLGSLLYQSGVMGVPHEYFHVESVTKHLCNRWDLKEPIETQKYIDAIFNKHTTENGIFGLKAHFQQIKPLLDKPSFHSFLKTTQVYLHITRRDVMAQAISYTLAHQTQNWSSLQKAVRQPTYDSALINTALDDILMQNMYWKKFFALNNITPIEITYEELLGSPHDICQNICAAMNIKTNHQFTIESSPLKQQRTQLNEDWTNRFRLEKRIC